MKARMREGRVLHVGRLAGGGGGYCTWEGLRGGEAGTASWKCTRLWVRIVRATLPAQGGEAVSAGRFDCGLEEAWTPGSGGGECRCMPFVLVLVRAEQRERGAFTYASKDAREHDDRLLLTRCPEIRHHRGVETRGDLRRHFENARPGPRRQHAALEQN